MKPNTTPRLTPMQIATLITTGSMSRPYHHPSPAAVAKARLLFLADRRQCQRRAMRPGINGWRHA